MDNFYFLTHDFTDADFNLASEEYLLKIKGGYYFYVWRNAPSVIIGVNQNAVEEVNLSFTQKNGIKVIRRLTGGGAVYHDLNNINYTVIAPATMGENAFVKFTKPVIEYLKSLGINAEFTGRNDLTVDGKKISGNAETFYKDRVMHHGTLLFNTDMSVLESALKPNKLKIESKGIKSVRSRVTNIYNELNGKMTVDEFYQGLRDYFSRFAEKITLSKEDISEIERLKKEKYSTFEWNIGRSPIGKTEFSFKFPFGVFSLFFDLLDGKITSPKIYGDFFSLKPVELLEKKLEGVKFIKADFLERVKDIGDYILDADGVEIARKIFDE